MSVIKGLSFFKMSPLMGLLLAVFSGLSFSQSMQVWNEGDSQDFSLQIEVDSVTFVWGGYDTLKIWNENDFIFFVVQSEVDSVTFSEYCSNVYNDSSFFDCRDGKEYPYVEINGEIWMAKNLNFDDGSNGSTCYGNLQANCDYYGRLYTFESARAVDSVNTLDSIQGVCPKDWYLSRNEDWDNLASFIQQENSLGAKVEDDWPGVGFYLKMKKGWSSANLSTDSLGFRALAGGWKEIEDGSYLGKGLQGFWWTSTPIDSAKAYSRYLQVEHETLKSYEDAKADGNSIRCLLADKSKIENLPISSSLEMSSQEMSSSEGISISSIADLSSAIEVSSSYELSSSSQDTSVSSAVVISSNTVSSSALSSSELASSSSAPYEFGSLTDSRDAKVYKTVEIGNQIWMAENLNFQADSNSYCYQDSLGNCNSNGRLYTWSSVMDSDSSSGSNPSEVQGLCPTDWHLPSQAEWDELANYIDNHSSNEDQDDNGKYVRVGKYLKKNLAWNSYGGITNLDSFNFGAAGSGLRLTSGSYSSMGSLGLWWSATEQDSVKAQYVSMAYNHDYFEKVNTSKAMALSVRCLKNGGVVYSSGTSSSSQSEGVFMDERDRKEYKWERIGSQNWMVENLNFDAGEGSFCYNYLPTNCETYGRLYLWESASKGASSNANPSAVQGVCPENWHLPSDAEWEELASYVATDQNLQAKTGDNWVELANTLKSKTHWNTASGTDNYGFKALAAGRRGTDSIFYKIGENAYFWSSSAGAEDFSWGRTLYDVNATLGNYTNQNKFAFSVRCVQDTGSMVMSSSSNASSSSFETGTFTDSRDSQKYNWVKIGEQKWMSQNLAYLPEVSRLGEGSEVSGSQNDKFYYVYDFDLSSVAQAKATDHYKNLGVLYNWKAAMDGEVAKTADSLYNQGVCPTGWHLPKDSEWEQLAEYIANESSLSGQLGDSWLELGVELKGKYFWHNNGAGNDAYGWDGVPGGARYNSKYFGERGESGFWWSSTPNDAENSLYRGLHWGGDSFDKLSSSNSNAFSIRCVEDF